MKRTDKTKYEWKKAYMEKVELMREWGVPEVTPQEFYRDLFPEGSLEKRGEINSGKGNIVASCLRPSGSGRTRQWTIYDDLQELDRVVGDKFGLIPPISFYGRTHSKKNAHELFALAIDIDYVGKQQFKNLYKQFGNGVQLKPTYVVSSGKGVHVYYFLKEPLELYRNREEKLAELKELFIKRLWNDTSSIRPENPDITGIYQGFRCVGSQTKLGADFTVRAWKFSDERYTLEDMQAFFKRWHKDIDLTSIYEKPKNPSKLSLEEAKELYPEWYERRVVRKEPKKQGTWVCNEALYEWWKNKIMNEVQVGGRYFSIMALCAYGLKCGISETKIRRDAYSFLEHLESLSFDDDNHFTREDVKDALKALKADKKLLSTMASREWIEKQTKVSIPPSHRPKGKRLKQKDHLEVARQMQAIRDRANGTDWREGNGRPDKAEIVEEWQKAHPDGTKAECNRQTGIDPKTIRKWWREGEA